VTLCNLECIGLCLVVCVCCKAAGEKEWPLSYLFVDDDDNSASDATALIYKLHTSDTIK